MKILLFVFGLLLVACKAEPEPLLYGQDACHSCKMTLADKKFGAEIVTQKGKIYKFDDTNCMLNYRYAELQAEEIAFTLVVDYTQPEKLIPVEHAFFLKTDSIHTPMNGGIAAFEAEDAMQEYKKQWKAIYLGWGEVQTQFK